VGIKRTTPECGKALEHLITLSEAVPAGAQEAVRECIDFLMKFIHPNPFDRDGWNPSEEFKWNADEALKLLDAGARIVLFKDGLGDITAISAGTDGSLDRAVRRWRAFMPPPPAPGATEEEQMDAIRRNVFEGPNRFSGGGRTVAQALHCLTEKVLFNRLPDGRGGYREPPPEKK